MKKLISSLLILVSGAAYAQIETTLPSLTSLNQASYLNPSLPAEMKFSFGLGGAATTTSYSGFELKDITQNITAEGRLDLPSFYNNIKGNGIVLNSTNSADLFHVRFKSKNMTFGLNIANKSIINEELPKDFLGLIINGSDYFAGSSANMSNISLTNMSYNEIGLNVARSFKKFDVGIRAKMYQGLAVALTENMKFDIAVPSDPTLPLTLTLGGTIKTSGLALFTDSVNGGLPIPDDTADLSLTSFDNIGFGVDVGFTYKFTEKFQLSLSVLDIGKIKWTNQSFVYQTNEASINFNGIDYDQINDTTSGGGISGYFDSIATLLKPNAIRESFSTAVPLRVFLQGNYKLTPKNIAGLMFQGQYFNKKWLTAYTASFTHRFGTRFDLTANYSLIGNKSHNLGVGFCFRLAGLQLYLMQDNILIYTNPETTDLVSARVGLNIALGSLAKKEKKEKNKEKTPETTTDKK